MRIIETDRYKYKLFIKHEHAHIIPLMLNKANGEYMDGPTFDNGNTKVNSLDEAEILMRKILLSTPSGVFGSPNIGWTHEDYVIDNAIKYPRGFGVDI